ncbi:protein phosphatase 1 regulatory inhibitor subunit PPP1R8 homolog [Argentina anserina]|uniref:protein phosphatase 1 regulatory inhibitor subunit PPP1R8 homolog n=1 Tax=Argentina anserina TaxID=57926 RepID=UPI002176830B|nr:protein phosphatase 1 regulatory inhibitor subunit PPP1R8 homolog [Potentilla anserina]
MYGRFRKAQSLEPFSVNAASAPVPIPIPIPAGQIGEGHSSWLPPEWAMEPRPGVYFLQVFKDGQLLDRIPLDKRRNIFGRQSLTCDHVLDHQSVSRQHAALVPHKNGSIYVIDLGSAHGTFVANERVTKDTPVELEVGQSLRFAASTRVYVLRKNDAALFHRPPLPSELDLPPPPDPSDEEAVVAYNTLFNRYGLTKLSKLPRPDESANSANKNGGTQRLERASKRPKKARVSFRDQVGGELVQIVGISDGVDVDTEPGPIGVKEGQSLVGKYGSLVQSTVIPKGKEQSSANEANTNQKGMTEKLQQVLNRVKSAPKDGIYDDLYGEFHSGKLGTSWAYPSITASPSKDSDEKPSNANKGINSGHVDDDYDDLFGD